MKKLIVTVCTGNICRSVLAEVFLSQEIAERGLAQQYKVESRGLQGMAGRDPSAFENFMQYDTEWSAAAPVFREADIHWPSEKHSTPVDAAVMCEASIVLAMDRAVLKTLQEAFPSARSKIILFSSLTGDDVDVPDPHGKGSPELYRFLLAFIGSTIRDHFDELCARCHE